MRRIIELVEQARQVHSSRPWCPPLSAPSIIDALLLSYNLWAPTVVVPLVAGVVWGSSVAGLAAIVAGGAMAVWQTIVPVVVAGGAVVVGVIGLRFYLEELRD